MPLLLLCRRPCLDVPLKDTDTAVAVTAVGSCNLSCNGRAHLAGVGHTDTTRTRARGCLRLKAGDPQTHAESPRLPRPRQAARQFTFSSVSSCFVVTDARRLGLFFERDVEVKWWSCVLLQRKPNPSLQARTSPTCPLAGGCQCRASALGAPGLRAGAARGAAAAVPGRAAARARAQRTAKESPDST